MKTFIPVPEEEQVCAKLLRKLNAIKWAVSESRKRPRVFMCVRSPYQTAPEPISYRLKTDQYPSANDAYKDLVHDGYIEDLGSHAPRSEEAVTDGNLMIAYLVGVREAHTSDQVLAMMQSLIKGEEYDVSLNLQLTDEERESLILRIEHLMSIKNSHQESYGLWLKQLILKGLYASWEVKCKEENKQLDENYTTKKVRSIIPIEECPVPLTTEEEVLVVEALKKVGDIVDESGESDITSILMFKSPLCDVEEPLYVKTSSGLKGATTIYKTLKDLGLLEFYISKDNPITKPNIIPVTQPNDVVLYILGVREHHDAVAILNMLASVIRGKPYVEGAGMPEHRDSLLVAAEDASDRLKRAWDRLPRLHEVVVDALYIRYLVLEAVTEMMGGAIDSISDAPSTTQDKPKPILFEEMPEGEDDSPSYLMGHMMYACLKEYALHPLAATYKCLYGEQEMLTKEYIESKLMRTTVGAEMMVDRVAYLVKHRHDDLSDIIGSKLIGVAVCAYLGLFKNSEDITKTYPGDTETLEVMRKIANFYQGLSQDPHYLVGIYPSVYSAEGKVKNRQNGDTFESQENVELLIAVLVNQFLLESGFIK